MENGTQSNSASIPVPAPRKKHTPPDRPVKPSAGIRSSVDKPPIAHKPPIAAKPKISPKPSLEPKSSAITPKVIDSTEQASMIQKQRPLSIKVTDDGIHNKVANELSSILCKPRTTSKGLLSPTNYSSEQNSGSTLESPIASQAEGGTSALYNYALLNTQTPTQILFNNSSCIVLNVHEVFNDMSVKICVNVITTSTLRNADAFDDVSFWKQFRFQKILFHYGCKEKDRRPTIGYYQQ